MKRGQTDRQRDRHCESFFENRPFFLDTNFGIYKPFDRSVYIGYGKGLQYNDCSN